MFSWGAELFGCFSKASGISMVGFLEFLGFSLGEAMQRSYQILVALQLSISLLHACKFLPRSLLCSEGRPIEISVAHVNDYKKKNKARNLNPVNL